MVYSEGTSDGLRQFQEFQRTLSRRVSFYTRGWAGVVVDSSIVPLLGLVNAFEKIAVSVLSQTKSAAVPPQIVTVYGKRYPSETPLIVRELLMGLPDDQRAYVKVLEGLDYSGSHSRFHGVVTRSTYESHARIMAKNARFTLGAFIPGEEDPVGVADVMPYDTGRPDCAEIAFCVAKKAENTRVGTRLMTSVLAKCVARGIKTLIAETEPTNKGMRLLAKRTGFNQKSDGSLISCRLDILESDPSQVRAFFDVVSRGYDVATRCAIDHPTFRGPMPLPTGWRLMLAS